MVKLQVNVKRGENVNISLLKKIMAESGFSQKDLAKKMGICSFLLWLKFGGGVDFKLEEILKISQILFLNEKQINNIFFSKEVS